MQFIDTHSHIYDPDFDADLHEVMQRAQEVGAKAIVLPNVSTETLKPMLDVCDKYPLLCYPAIGIHPEEINADYHAKLEVIHRLLHEKADRFIAIGEIGIDLYWDSTFQKEQLEAFRIQLEWSIQYKLPIIIHCRQAHRELINAILPYRDHLIGGVFHCFGGSTDDARELLEFPNFYLGIGGFLTFKKSTLPTTLKELVPLERLVVETDAPYLTPSPFRGKRNEPSYIPYIIEKLATIYEKDIEEVANVLLTNSKRLFNLQ